MAQISVAKNVKKKFPQLISPKCSLQLSVFNLSHPMPAESTPYPQKYFLKAYFKFSSHTDITPPPSRFSAIILD
jgi:hypothetical protein